MARNGLHRADRRLGGRRARPVSAATAAPGKFVCRDGELAALTAIPDGDGPDGPVGIAAITGAGGIGKTWLALHWAHRNADRFPDGHLFVDLQGFSPAATPVDPATAVRGFLDALGVDPRSVPPDPRAQAALYRTLVADKRMLVVLDNARTHEQIVPLLPGGRHCLVLVTSRGRLTELLTRHGARSVPVDVFDPGEARQALTARLGGERLAAEPGAAAELSALCGGLPLALGIVASHAEVNPRFALAASAAELRDTATRLDVLDDGSPATGLSAVMSWSCSALTGEQARVFALLGSAPGPDIGLSAAADLAGLPEPVTWAALRALTDLHLVRQDTPGRWRMHDLVRLYSTSRADRNLDPADLDAALRRVAGFYLRTAHAADGLLEPQRPVTPIKLDATRKPPRPLTDRVAALDWLSTEYPALLEVLQLCARRRWRTTVWQLAWCLDTFQKRQGRVLDRLNTWRIAFDALDALDDRGDRDDRDDLAVRVVVHRFLGHAAAHAGSHAEARARLEQALALAERHGDRAELAETHRIFAQACSKQERFDQALDHATRALRLYRELGGTVHEAPALNLVGWYHARLGNHAQARVHCEAALALAHRYGHHSLEADVRDSLGYIAHHTGDHTTAVDHFEQALARYRNAGDVYFLADTLDRLGQAHHALGRQRLAHAAWRQAMELYRSQHRTADALRVEQELAERGRSPLPRPP